MPNDLPLWLWPVLAAVYLTGWFGTARLLLRRHLEREICEHGESIAGCRRERRTRTSSLYDHAAACPTTVGEKYGRSPWDLVLPCVAAAVWPLVLLPCAVCVSVPATTGELRQLSRDLDVEIERLENATR